MLCPHDPADLNRPCMFYKLCGCHIFGTTVEDIQRSIDGFPCPHRAGNHLYVHQPGLVVPTRECRVAHQENALLAFHSAEEARTEPPAALLPGDWEIEGWRKRGPYLEVIVGDEPLVAQAVA